MSRTLQRRQRKHLNNRRKHERAGSDNMAKQEDGNLKLIGFASRFSSDTEKKYVKNELELLAVVWRMERFRLYIYGKPIDSLTKHQAL